MGTPYTVVSGDTLSKIAQRHGYSSWQEIYNHPENADFRQRRPDPGHIYPGDVLILPDREPAETPPPTPPPAEPEPTEPSAPEPPETEPQTGEAPRRAPEGEAGAVLNTRYELREILVAQGIQFHNTDMASEDRVPRGIVPMLPDSRDHEWVTVEDNSAEIVSHAQHVRFRIRVVNTKNEFKDALQTPGLHVIYDGHARYGRGPCFGPNDDPGDNWEMGTDRNSYGLFRMGYPYIGVHYSEMREHGYSFSPVPSTVQMARTDRHPEIPSSVSAVALPDDLQTKLLPEATSADRYWGFRDHEGRGVVLYAGWKDTLSDPMELDKVNLQCRCFCTWACSTRLHWWKAVRKWKNWTRSEMEGFAYFTTAVAYSQTTHAWIKALVEYSQRNDYQSWYPSLEYAKRRGNQLLARWGYSYRIY